MLTIRRKLGVLLALVIALSGLTMFVAAPANAAVNRGTVLTAGQQLGSGDWLQSGAYRLVMQDDGNLVVYGPSGALWASYTNAPGAYLENGNDGNLVIYRGAQREVVWASRSRGAGNLTMQDDGNVVLYGSVGVWNTYTNGGVSRMVQTRAVAYARAQLGKGYLYGGTGPDRFDCSGLTMRAYESAGVGIGRTTYNQWDSTRGRSISRGELQPGDLIFYNNRGHVGMYVGNNEIINALNSSNPVKYSSVDYGDPIAGFRHYA